MTFFLELSYIFFSVHLIMFSWILDVMCGRRVETDGHGKVDPSLHQAITVGTAQRVAGLTLPFQSCDCLCGPSLVHGCWDGPASLWLSAPWELFPVSAQPQESMQCTCRRLHAPDEAGGGLPCPILRQPSSPCCLFCAPNVCQGRRCWGEARPVSDARLTGLGRAICV